MRRKPLLQRAAEGIGRGIDRVHGAQRQKTVAVDGIDGDIQPSRRCGDHPRQEEHRRIVGHDQGGIAGDRLEQPGARARSGLEIG
jgi:hypothetical protein